MTACVILADINTDWSDALMRLPNIDVRTSV